MPPPTRGASAVTRDNNQGHPASIDRWLRHNGPMTDTERIAIAVGVVAVDLLLFALPLTGLFAAYVILARPQWFRDWVDRLYEVQ